MQDYSHPLGDAVKIARNELGLTQEQVASQIDADARTISSLTTATITTGAICG